MRIKLMITAILVMLFVSAIAEAREGRVRRRKYTVYNREADVHQTRHRDPNVVYDGDRVLYKKYDHSQYWHSHYYDHEHMGFRRHGRRGYRGPRDYNRDYNRY